MVLLFYNHIITLGHHHHRPSPNMGSQVLREVGPRTNKMVVQQKVAGANAVDPADC